MSSIKFKTVGSSKDEKNEMPTPASFVDEKKRKVKNNEEKETRGSKKVKFEKKVLEPDTTPNVEFFSNFTIRFCKDSIKNYYFIIEVLGQEDFRFYKAKMNRLLTALNQAIIASNETGNDFSVDRELYCKEIDRVEDDERGYFKSNLEANIFCNRLGIFYRVYVISDEINDWVPTTRAIKFDYNEKEYEKLIKFVNLKLLHASKARF